MKDILIAFVHVFAMMAPWLVFGFMMAGIIAVWIPRSWVNRMMGGSSGFRGILRAVGGEDAATVAVIVIGAILCGIAINLVPNALPASAPITTAGHSLSIVHWACAAFLAVMMAYNLARPLGMGRRSGAAHG